MKEWKCPFCKRVRKYEEELVMKVCPCGEQMEVVEDGNEEYIKLNLGIRE